MRRQGGFVLVIVLLVVALLTGMTVTFINDVYLETGSNRVSVEATQGSLFADSGISLGLQLLTRTLKDRTYSSLNDLWAKPVFLEEEQGSLKLLITEESGRLNLNMITLPNGNAHPVYNQIAARLLKKLNLSPDLLDALSDWIDEDEIPNPGGAEAVWYLARRQPLQPRNGQLATIEELAHVKGFAGEAFNKLRPFITVYAEGNRPVTAAPVNINTAPREVLEALDERITPELADRIIEYRRTTPFEHPAELGHVTGMSDIMPSLLTFISVKGTVYRIISEATVNGTRRTIEVFARISGANSTILYWREY